MRRRRHGRGSATVELAAAIPLLAAVTLAMVGVIVVARDAVLAQGAAREGAREAALGGDRARAAAAARAAVPAGRSVRVSVTPLPSGLVRVEVVLAARVLPGTAAIGVRAAAVSAVEPGPAPAGP
jgi:Flp pilus assembly protein TadG